MLSWNISVAGPTARSRTRGINWCRGERASSGVGTHTLQIARDPSRPTRAIGCGTTIGTRLDQGRQRPFPAALASFARPTLRIHDDNGNRAAPAFKGAQLLRALASPMPPCIPVTQTGIAAIGAAPAEWETAARAARRVTNFGSHTQKANAPQLNFVSRLTPIARGSV